MCVCLCAHVPVIQVILSLYQPLLTADPSDSTDGTTSPLDGASQTDLNGEDSNMLNIHTVFMFSIRPIIYR